MITPQSLPGGSVLHGTPLTLPQGSTQLHGNGQVVTVIILNAMILILILILILVTGSVHQLY
jgi:hypothetical protein